MNMDIIYGNSDFNEFFDLIMFWLSFLKFSIEKLFYKMNMVIYFYY